MLRCKIRLCVVRWELDLSGGLERRFNGVLIEKKILILLLNTSP